MNKYILTISDEKTNRSLANILLLCIGLFCVVLLLNELDIFVVEKTPMRIVTVIFAAIMAFPKVALLVRKKYENWMKYSTITCASIAICLAYSVLTYHMIMPLVFPLILSVMYFDNRLTIFTAVETAVFMTAAHIVSASLFVVDDPLHTLHRILLYGLLPRLLIFTAFAIVCIILGKNTQNIFSKLNTSIDEINRTKDSLDTIIDASRKLYGAMNMLELAGLIKNAVYTVTSKVQGSSGIPVIAMGVHTEDGAFHHIDDNLTSGLAHAENGIVTVQLPNISFAYPLVKQKVRDDVQITPNGIGMSFYQDDDLLFYISMEFPVVTNDILLKSSLDILYSNIDTAMRQTKVNSDIFKTQESVILSFAEISESKSRQTGQHVKRVSEYVRVMALNTGFDEEKCTEIALAAMMHDIGKLLIPPEILEKPGRLTDEEFSVIKTHVTLGEELLKNSPGEVMSMARRIALYHHERWDGKGYLGYAGEKIDYISRFVSVADVFDALVSKRSYKDGWPPEKAYAEIVRQRGTQFAPHAVDVFVKSYDKIMEILKLYPDQVAQSSEPAEQGQ
ncbi:MAG: HD domain-containing protein [Ruminococcus sp.]|nr:HD domain-containing protein [Ruminococcus sp.]